MKEYKLLKNLPWYDKWFEFNKENRLYDFLAQNNFAKYLWEWFEEINNER